MVRWGGGGGVGEEVTLQPKTHCFRSSARLPRGTRVRKIRRVGKIKLASKTSACDTVGMRFQHEGSITHTNTHTDGVTPSNAISRASPSGCPPQMNDFR
jgi:hypothetical protein